jgi:hypothetical protein
MTREQICHRVLLKFGGEEAQDEIKKLIRVNPIANAMFHQLVEDEYKLMGL